MLKFVAETIPEESKIERGVAMKTIMDEILYATERIPGDSIIKPEHRAAILPSLLVLLHSFLHPRSPSTPR